MGDPIDDIRAHLIESFGSLEAWRAHVARTLEELEAEAMVRDAALYAGIMEALGQADGELMTADEVAEQSGLPLVPVAEMLVRVAERGDAVGTWRVAPEPGETGGFDRQAYALLRRDENER